MERFPESWKVLSLGDAVINITINGKKIPQKAYLAEGAYPVFDQGQDYIGGYSDDKEKLVECDLPVIIFGDHTRVVKFVNQPFAPGADGVKVLQPQRFYVPRLFEYFTRHIATHLKSHGYARHYQHLVKSTIPVPPLNEQHRIVAKIEELFSELDKGIEALKTAQAQLKVYRQALLKHAFEGKLTAQWRAERRTKNSVTPAQAGVHANEKLDSRLRGNDEPLESAADLLARIQQERAQRYQQQLTDWEAGGKQGTKPKAPKPLPPLTAKELAELPKLPEGWGWARLCDLSDQITDGTHHTPTYLPDGVPFISVKDIRDSKVSFDDCKFISPDEHRALCQRCNPEVDDLLITKSGTIGRMALVPNKVFSLFVSVALVKTKSVKDIVLPKWFLYAVEYHLLSLNIDQDIKGGLLKNYHLEDLRLAKIPLTCSDEQSVLVMKLEEHLSEADQLELTLATTLQQAEALRQSILKRAFSGQLVPQDPHDEPAAALLARIKAEKEAQSATLRKTGKGKA